ncbi:MAG: MATE family efflux transporter [Gammaproteobacteria bacterium]|nr:MATE family efflux transporter [Gammaproteobacteria bacterium]
MKNSHPTSQPVSITTEGKQLLTLAGPAILAQFAQMSMGVIDTVMAGQHSANALAAVAIGVSLFNPISIFIVGIFLALSPIIAHYHGQNNQQGIKQTFQTGLILGVVLAFPCAVLLYLLEPVMLFIGITEDIIPLANGYLQALAWGLIPLFCFFAMRFCNEGMFATNAIMYISLAALPFNILFNNWFINGGLGVPSMGAVGVGWATITVWTLMACCIFCYTVYARRYQGYHMFSRWLKPSYDNFSEIFKLGIPMGLALGMEVALFGAVGLMIGRYTVPDIAGHQVALNIASLAFTLSLGLSVAVTARVGFHSGQGNAIRAKNTGMLGIGFGMIIALFTASIMLAFSSQLTAVFTSDPQVTTVALQLIFLAAIFQISDGIQVNANGALRGMKDTKIPMYICTFAYWIVGFPIGYVLAEYFEMGVSGYWIAIITGLTLAAILLALRFIKISSANYK